MWEGEISSTAKGKATQLLSGVLIPSCGILLKRGWQVSTNCMWNKLSSLNAAPGAGLPSILTWPSPQPFRAQRAFPRLSGFIFSYRNYVNSILGSHEGDPEQLNGVLLRSRRRTFVPTKVAIIDNGILSISRVPADTPSSINGKAHKGKSKSTATKGMQPAMGSIKEKHQSTSQAYTNGAPVQDPLGTDDESKKASGKRHRDRFSGGGTLWSRIKDGQSFVDDEHRVSPWMFASDPHGTQMANLICALDPACELYVAKATDGNKYGTSSERVVRVRSPCLH